MFVAVIPRGLLARFAQSAQMVVGPRAAPAEPVVLHAAQVAGIRLEGGLGARRRAAVYGRRLPALPQGGGPSDHLGERRAPLRPGEVLVVRSSAASPISRTGGTSPATWPSRARQRHRPSHRRPPVPSVNCGPASGTTEVNTGTYRSSRRLTAYRARARQRGQGPTLFPGRPRTNGVGLRVGVGHTDRGAFLQREVVGDVGGQPRQEGQLVGARVAEHRAHSVLSEDAVEGFAHRGHTSTPSPLPPPAPRTSAFPWTTGWARWRVRSGGALRAACSGGHRPLMPGPRSWPGTTPRGMRPCAGCRPSVSSSTVNADLGCKAAGHPLKVRGSCHEPVS